jgi:hypothetical protein
MASALRDYESCLKIGLATMPIHPITAAAYYSIARVELEQKNIDNAKYVLPDAIQKQEFLLYTGTISRKRSLLQSCVAQIVMMDL